MVSSMVWYQVWYGIKYGRVSSMVGYQVIPALTLIPKLPQMKTQEQSKSVPISQYLILIRQLGSI